MEALLIIDGSSMLVTHYYGTLPKSVTFEKDPIKRIENYKDIMQTSTGIYTNGVFSMLRTIKNIIDYQKPSHIAVVFDMSRNTFRRDMFEEYKGTRSETPDPLKEQFIIIENILERMGITTLYSEKYEADDYAGTLVRKFEKKIPTIVMTKDHDYLQLVSENTKAWMVQSTEQKFEEMKEKYPNPAYDTQPYLPQKVIVFDASVVLAEEGVLPSMIPDLKGIAGDSADNIPGVKGVAKAAAPLLMEYGSIEKLYERIEIEGKFIEDYWKDCLDVKKGNYKKLTAEGAKESALLSKKLATIVDVPDFEIELDDMSIKKIDEDEFINICKEYEFDSLLNH